MADTRKFDYEAVKSIYLDMNKIIGDNNEKDSLSGIITTIDKDYHDMVGMVDEACYGALADQLLLDWDNTSSDFPKFIENFRNWSALVAQASGNYSAFEQQVTGMQNADKFGFAGSGLTNNYVNSSAYHDYATNYGEAFEFLNANMNDIYQLTGCTYLQSGASERLKTQKVLNTILCGGDVLAIAVLAAGAYNVLNPATAGSTELAIAEGNAAASTSTELATQQFVGMSTKDLATLYPQYASQAAALEAQGVSQIYATQSGVMYFCDSAGNIIGSTVANSGAAMSGAASTSGAAASSAGWWSTVKSGGTAAWNAGRGYASTAVNWAKTAGKSAVSYARAHPIRTAVAGGAGVSLVYNLNKD